MNGIIISHLMCIRMCFFDAIFNDSLRVWSMWMCVRVIGHSRSFIYLCIFQCMCVRAREWVSSRVHIWFFHFVIVGATISRVFSSLFDYFKWLCRRAGYSDFHSSWNSRVIYIVTIIRLADDNVNQTFDSALASMMTTANEKRTTQSQIVSTIQIVWRSQTKQYTHENAFRIGSISHFWSRFASQCYNTIW